MSELDPDLAAPRRRLWIAALVAIVFGGAVIAALALRDAEPDRPRDASRRPAPPPRGAFASGGRPDNSDPVLRDALGDALPDWIIALDRLGAAARDNDPDGYDRAERDMAEARARLDAAEVRRALGPDATARLERILTRAHAAAAAGSDQETERATERLLDAIGGFNDALAAAGAGFFLDGDVILGPNNRRIVLLYAFTVEHVRLFDAGGRRIRALQLRRLDQLNWSHRLLGFTSPHLREALVLLDQVDELLVNYVLPALAPNAQVELVDHDSSDPDDPWQREVRARAGDVIRAAYAATDPGDQAAAMARLGHLLDERRRLFEQWSDTLDRRGMTLREPRTLRVDDVDRLRAALAGAVPDDQLDALERIESELRAPAHDRLFAAARDVIIASVERHEVQHRVDAALAAPRPVPEALRDYVGPTENRRGEPRKLVTLARDELSAYLSSLARDTHTPRLQLTLIARFLLDRDRWGSAECYAALVIFEGLADELDIAVDGPLVERGAVARELVAGLYLALTDRPVADVRAAARRLWERLFDASLPPIDAVP